MPRNKKKVAIILPSSMIISGLTSGVTRQALGYKSALELAGINAEFISFRNNINEYSHALLIQHTPEIKLLIERIRTKNPKIKLAYLPIYDPDKPTSLLKKILYTIPTEKIAFINSPRLMRWACDHVDEIWVRSEWERNAILNTRTLSDINIVPLSLPFEIPIDFKRIKKDIDYLFVGHINDPRKNLVNLIKAISQIDAHLYIAGVGNMELIVSKLGNTSLKNFTYLGYLKDIELHSIYKRTKVICLPSYFEGVGLSAMEANAFGAIPAITSIGGAKDYFEDQAIYIDDPKSIIQISSRLRDALARSKKFGEKNTLFLNKYSIEALSQLFKKMKFFE